MDAAEVKIDKGKIGKLFKQQGQVLIKYLTAFEEDVTSALEFSSKLANG